MLLDQIDDEMLAAEAGREFDPLAGDTNDEGECATATKSTVASCGTSSDSWLWLQHRHLPAQGNLLNWDGSLEHPTRIL